MRLKTSHLVWLLPLLLILGSDDFNAYAVRYNQQVIAILEDNPDIQKAAHYLYQKHDTTSYVVKWNANTRMFERVTWNEQTQQHDTLPNQEPLPIRGQQEWKATRIQVIGHGNVNSYNQADTIGGFMPAELAETLTTSLSMGNVGRISIIGCTRRAELRSAPTRTRTPGYLRGFMDRLKVLGRSQTEVSIRSALVSVDQSGRKLTGELVLENIRGSPEVGIEWSHKNPSNKWIGKFSSSRRYEVEQSQVTATQPGDIESHFFGILPENTDVYVSKYNQGSASAPNTYKLTDPNAFEWVDRVAQNTYNNAPPGRAPETSRRVQFLGGSRAVRNVPVKELSGIDDLLTELHHYGQAGPAQQSSKVYYRFGDWVVSMNPRNFYVNVEGIITDPNDSAAKRVKIADIQNEWNNLPNGRLPEDYPTMQPLTGDNFFDDVRSWINGESNNIGLNLENAYNAQCGMAMFLSESIRSFQTHVTNMMSLDLVRHGYLSKEYFYKSHPMGRGFTWQVRKTGLEMLRDGPARAGNLPDPRTQRVYDSTLSRISRISKSWLSHMDRPTLKGSRSLPPQATPELYTNQKNVLTSVENIGEIQPHSNQYLREYELREATGRLLSTMITEPETESVDTQIEDFSSVEDISSPVLASLALANDHAFVSDLIAKQVQLKEQQTGREYEVIPDSVVVAETENSVRFRVQQKTNPTSEPEEISTAIDKSKLTSKALVDDLQAKASELNNPGTSEGTVSRINRGLAIYGIVRGLTGAIGALENGNITQGAIGLAQSLHGIGELSGINKAIYKAAGKYLGRVLRNQVKNIGESISTVAGEDIGNLAKATGGELLSTVGEVGDFLEDVPIVGTAFGIYNIYEDFQQHSTLGYIDAGLDIAITGLSLLGPEAEPVVLALTIIRMGIDTFYRDISNELKALPPDASVSMKVGAVFKGIGNAFVDLFEEFTLPGQIFGAIDNSHKLDEQYDKDRALLRKLSDYRNYFSIVKEEGTGAEEINFAGGSEFWNGGDISFQLGETGQSTLSLEDVDSNGNVRHETHTVNTVGVEDIVMGIGESHSISFKKQTVKFLWFIPVHSRTLISGESGIKQTLHGTYYGNSQNNKFIAVQKLPPKGGFDYNLHDYYYRLYGREGDDTFYLGPQHSYVEGNDGIDTYFVDSSSVYTEINNYADDGKNDYLIMKLDYARLRAERIGLNLKFTTTDNTHTILIDNWFHDDTYQHIIFKTEDGVLFKVSATGTGGVGLIPYAFSGAMSTSSAVFDARAHDFSQVMTLSGSPHDDMLYGNDMDNQLNGGKGDDTLSGGEGKDTYSIDFHEGIDTIDNFATDGKTDILLFAAKYDDIIAFSSPATNHLNLAREGSTGNQLTGALVKDWFVSEQHRHMILVSEDGVVLNVSSTKDTFVKLQPIMVDMSLISPVDPPTNIAPQRRIDLSSDPLLAEVVTVIGSAQNDFMVGNHKDNYMSGGTGYDTMEGKGGQDVYVVKAGDGTDIIKNYAPDESVDSLLFGANYDDIELSSSDGDLVISAHVSVPKKKIQVTVENYFSGGSTYQHLVVRSADGIVFELPKTHQSIVKVAKIIDNSNVTTDLYLTLNGKWSQVERVLGSKGFKDTITGNSLTNYMDPGTGRCHLKGQNGSDTYVIRNYGKGNLIDNYAEDNYPDTVVFTVPFFSIDAKVRNNNDIQLTSITSRGHVNTRLINYVSEPKSRHLTVVTEDGYSFVLPPTNNYKPVPILINRERVQTGQHINLTANSTFSEVQTVYGSKDYQNCIIGNQRNNTIVGGSQADSLEGLEGDDTIKGGAGNDKIQGGPGDDILVGGDGNDELDGGEDDDVISPGHGVNVVDGGSGTDTVIYGGQVSTESGIHLNLQHKTCIHDGNSEDQLKSIENAYGTEFSDMLQGDDQDNVLVGQGGDDYLAPGSGYDLLKGGSGNDTYDLAAANGTVIISNFAKDRALDKVIMTYTNMSNLRYEKAGNDLVIRVINTQYLVFYDGTKPTVIFKGWYIDTKYHHAYVETADGRIESKFLKRHAREAARATNI